MVRQRSVLIARLILGCVVGLSCHASPTRAQTEPTPGDASPAIETSPYRIKVMLAADADARFNATRRERLIHDWLENVGRFVGPPWRLEIVAEDQARPWVLGRGLDLVDSSALESLSAEVEKVWLIRIGGAGSAVILTGREYDTTVRRLGTLLRREVAVPLDLPRELLRFAMDLFAPLAVIGERFGKEAVLSVRGSALSPATEEGRVVRVGTVFQPFRVAPRNDGPAIIREIPYTYLRVESLEGGSTRCAFLSMFSDPFTGRVVQRTQLLALGTRPGSRPTSLRFLTLPDRAPAAGYALTARSVPDGLPREVGLTDREGRITLPPGLADGLTVFRLVAGGDEPMREFPLMPGVQEGELVVPPFDPRPLTVALESRLETLRDEVIDLVAVRARLEARLKARFEGEDWAGAEEALREFAALPPRESLADALTRLKDEATRKQAETKTAILTKTAQARVAELQGLIERYLDDDVFRGFADALDKLKTDKDKDAPPKAAASKPKAP
ncbi:MAG: hypothetical protein AB7I30_14020 [Isosphaeraceae bacterium]